MYNMIKLAARVGRRSSVSRRAEGNTGAKPGIGQRVYHAGGSSGIVLYENGVPHHIHLTPAAREAVRAGHKSGGPAPAPKDPKSGGPAPAEPAPAVRSVPRPVGAPLVANPVKWYNPSTWFKGPRLNLDELRLYTRDMKPGETIYPDPRSGVKLTMLPDHTIFQSYPGYWKAPLLGTGLGASGFLAATLAATHLLNSDDEPQPAPKSVEPVPAPATKPATPGR